MVKRRASMLRACFAATSPAPSLASPRPPPATPADGHARRQSRPPTAAFADGHVRRRPRRHVRARPDARPRWDPPPGHRRESWSCC